MDGGYGIDDDGDYSGNDYGIVTVKEEVTVIDMEETTAFVSVDIVVVWWWWWSLWLKNKVVVDGNEVMVFYNIDYKMVWNKLNGME